MNCRLVDMREKQVICVRDGTIIGSMCDIIVDTCSGKVVSIVVLRGMKFLGLFGRDDDIIIPWESIQVMGDETILVDFDPPKHRKRSFFKRFGAAGDFHN